jgi:hypothetical protein
VKLSRNLTGCLGFGYYRFLLPPAVAGDGGGDAQIFECVVRALVDGSPEDWEVKIPYAQCILRIVPMKVLGGRSPYEVVLGLKPKLPASLLAGVRVEAISVDEYVGRLVQYFEQTYQELKQKFQEECDRAEGRGPGRVSAKLSNGDAVLIKREPTARREGPLRFQDRAYPHVYKIVDSIGDTFKVACWHDPLRPVPVKNPIHADRLVKLDMPELELRPDQPRTLEILEPDADPEEGWVRWRVERFARDGMVQLRREDQPGVADWFDLSRTRYRWVLPGHGGP